jgi:hypothetical protein
MAEYRDSSADSSLDDNQLVEREASEQSMPESRTTPPRHRRSSMLLTAVVNTGAFTLRDLAEALATSEADLQACASNERALSLSRQLCLALFVIERLPALARRGHALRGQVGAALAMEAKITATHAYAPVRYR